MLPSEQPATRVQALRLMRQADELLRALVKNGDAARNQILEALAFLASAIVALDRRPAPPPKT
jgi:hypothetical protein